MDCLGSHLYVMIAEETPFFPVGSILTDSQAAMLGVRHYSCDGRELPENEQELISVLTDKGFGNHVPDLRAIVVTKEDDAG